MKVEEVTVDECREILEKMKMGRLACSANNQPYIVPVSFAFDGVDCLYAFSTLGQKIRWMRENPLICVETDDVRDQENWTTMIVFGRYEELPDEPKFEEDRIRAHKLLSRRPMWWQPGYAAGTHNAESDLKPIYFRVLIEKITGHRAVIDDPETFMSVGQPEELYKRNRHQLW